MAKKRHFGNVRKRASGRWQARYPGPDGRLRSAPDTFARKSDAEQFLSIAEAQMARGEWIDPERAKVPLGAYATRWIDQRAGLRPRTVELYRSLLRCHIAPTLGEVPLSKIDTPMVREWRAQLLASGVSAGVTAKAYRLLRAVLMTAVHEDRILHRNPCHVRGADRFHTAERPVLTVAQVVAIAGKVPKRFRAMILLITFASLRFGEAAALQRRDLDLSAGTLRIQRTFTEVTGKGVVTGPPKSAAGTRTVAMPPAVTEVMREHLAEYVGSEPTALVFTGPEGGPLRRGTIRQRLRWKKTLEGLDLKGVTLHDLRHTGNTLASRSGVSTRDLMARMGHDSMRAALLYQHATDEAAARIAQGLDGELRGALRRLAEQQPGSDKRGTEGEKPDDDEGTGGVLVPA